MKIKLNKAYFDRDSGVDLTVGGSPTSTPTNTNEVKSTFIPPPTQMPSKIKSTYGGVQGLDEYKNLVNQKTSALSSLNQANQLAMKYADNTALAQGYATQGAMLQNNANLQSAYLNQTGQINQNFQNQLGSLEDKSVANNFNDFSETK